MHEPPKSKGVAGALPVILALLENLFITFIKFFGFSISGSGALFSEAIHSTADTLNQALLLIGLRSSLRIADKDFSYGYGKERFFWALISACGIFFLGAGVTIYHGVELLLSPEVPHIEPVIFLILFVSFVVEGATLVAALRELRARHPGERFTQALKYGDPATIAVVYEDSVAVIGVAVALVSISLTQLMQNPLWDALGSILIGTLLGGVAITLIRKNRKYLIGVNIPDRIRKQVIEIIEADPAIDKVIDFKSSILDIGSYHVKCEVEFNGSALMPEISEHGNLKRQFDETRGSYEEFLRFLVDYVERIPRLIGTRIDEIEKRVQQELPEIRHIDIELN